VLLFINFQGSQASLLWKPNGEIMKRGVPLDACYHHEQSVRSFYL